jgi:hypothetical protein
VYSGENNLQRSATAFSPILHLLPTFFAKVTFLFHSKRHASQVLLDLSMSIDVKSFRRSLQKSMHFWQLKFVG